MEVWRREWKLRSAQWKFEVVGRVGQVIEVTLMLTMESSSISICMQLDCHVDASGWWLKDYTCVLLHYFHMFYSHSTACSIPINVSLLWQHQLPLLPWGSSCVSHVRNTTFGVLQSAEKETTDTVSEKIKLGSYNNHTYALIKILSLPSFWLRFNLLWIWTIPLTMAIVNGTVKEAVITTATK